jgi:hypothetical protein
MADATKTYTVRVVGDAASVKRSFRDAETAADKFAKKMNRVGKTLSSFGDKMSRNVTLPIVAGLGLATKAAVDEEKEMALLSKALTNNAAATDAQVASIEKWITAQQNATGIADGELRPALAALVAVTKDTGKAQDLLTIAMDLAAAKGKDVTTMAEAIAKAQNGNIGILSRYGIATRDATGKMMTFDEVMQNAVKTFGGSAAVAAQTTAGKLNILKARFADVSESIGNAVIPIFEKLIPVVEKIAKWFEGLSEGQLDFIVKAGLVVAAVGPLLSIFGRLIKTVGALTKAYQWLATTQTTMTGTGFFQAGKWSELSKSSSRFATVLGRIGKTAGALGLVASAGYGIFEAFRRIDQEAGFQQFGQFFKDFGLSGEREFKRTVENYARMAQRIEGNPIDLKVKTDEANRKLNATLATWERIKKRAGGPIKFTADDSALLATLMRIQLALAATSRQARRTAQEIANAIAAAGGHTGFEHGNVPLASGADFIASRPTPILVGEAGPERVTVNPLSGPNAGKFGGAGGGIGPVTIPIYLDGREIAAYTVNLMSRQARRLARGMA